jgi:Tfp pilus assembly pilus retraction ATPase PilT
VYSGLCRLYRNLTPFNTDNLDVDLKYSVKDFGRVRVRCFDSSIEFGLATRTLTLVLLAVEVLAVEEILSFIEEAVTLVWVSGVEASLLERELPRALEVSEL